VEAEELRERDGRAWRRIGGEEIDERGRVAPHTGVSAI